MDETPKVPTIGTSNSAHKSDKAWLIKGYEPWVCYRSVNLPFFESQQVDRMFADPLTTGSSAIKLLNDSPDKRFNKSSSYKLRDQQLSQNAPKIYDPSKVFDDVSHYENRNPQVQRSDPEGHQGHST